MLDARGLGCGSFDDITAAPHEACSRIARVAPCAADRRNSHMPALAIEQLSDLLAVATLTLTDEELMRVSAV